MRGMKRKLTPQVDLHIYNFSGCLTARYPAKLIARGITLKTQAFAIFLQR